MRKFLLVLIGILGLATWSRAQIIMGNGSTVACSGTFYDNGGTGNYSNSQDLVYTIYPTPGNNLQVAFSSFTVETCCDWLRIYDGPNTSAPMIGQYTGNPGTIVSTASDGSLTFVFHSDGSVTSAGWQATLSCVPTSPCSGPISLGTATPSSPIVCSGSNFSISISGGNLSNAAFQWQSSTDGIVWTDVPGQTGLGFSGTQTSSNNYRLRAICLGGNDTTYSSVAFVDVVNCINMTNATITTCGSILYDSGGPNGTHQPNEDYVLTVNPLPGNYLQAEFLNFTLETCCDWLRIYDGSNTNAPLIGQYNSNPGTVLATSSSGSLTFQFHSDGSVQYAGWQANLSCVPKPAREVELVSIDSPQQSQCSFTNEIKVSLQNNGADTINSAVFDIRTNGILQANIPWSGTIYPGDIQQATITGTLTYGSGDSINVMVRQVNGLVDADTTDNAKGTRTFLGLSGVYKVGFGVTAADSIADIPTAISMLQARGVCDTLYFDLKDDTYEGNYIINQYPSWEQGKMVIFRSLSQNADNVILTDSAASAAQNYIFRLNGADGVGFQYLTFKPRSVAFRNAIDIRNGAHSIFIDHNKILADSSNTGTGTGNFDQILISSASATTDNNTIITHNLLSGGSRGINLGAASGQYETGHIIRNNTIRNIAYLSAIVEGSKGLVFEGNRVEVSPTSTLASTTGLLYSNSIEGGSIAGNEFRSNKPGFLVALSNVKGGGQLGAVRVNNNFLLSTDSVSLTGNTAIGIANANSSNIDVVNNSISNYTSNAALYVADGSSVTILNNNIASWAIGAVVRIDKSYSVIASDHNNFYSASGTLANYLGNNYSSLAGFQAATGKDAASISVLPGFNGLDLHTCAPELNAAGQALGYITVDFDGDLRSSTPDIGADEFIGGTDALVSADHFLKCPDETVSFGNAPVSGVSYVWTPGGFTTSSISTATAGIYTVAATGACGTALDTVTVENKPAATASFTVAGVYGLVVNLDNTSTNGIGYFWDFGDGGTSNEFEPLHQYSPGAATYTITLTVYGECDTVTFSQPVTTVDLSVDEFLGTQVNLYPNPAVESINIQFGDLGKTMARFDIIDISGKTVTTVSRAVEGNSIINLPVEHLSGGIYTVRITANGNTSNLRFIKN